MSSRSSKYRRLMRLRAKLKRLQRHISLLEQSLDGYQGRWGSCSFQRNRR